MGKAEIRSEIPSNNDLPTGIRSTPKTLPSLKPRNQSESKIGPRIDPHQIRTLNTMVRVSMFSNAVCETEAVARTWDKLKSTKTDAKTKSTLEKRPTWTVSPPPPYTRRNNRTNIPMLSPNNNTRAQKVRKF